MSQPASIAGDEEAMRRHWRSLLFAPANQQRLVNRLGSSGADAVILDLEDSVAEAEKSAARGCAADAISALYGQGQDIIVRINAGWRAALRDLESVVLPGLRAIVAPKVEGKARLNLLAELIGELEQDRGMKNGEVGLIVLIETSSALFKLARVSTARRVLALALGPEDLATSLGVAPTRSVLQLPCQMLALAAAARGLMALGAPVSIADYRDVDGFRAGLREARAIGMTGALCIHPSQVTIANEVFAASPSEVASARAIVEAWARREGGVARLDGRMIDPPVVRRAERLLQRAAADAVRFASAKSADRAPSRS